LAFLEIHFSHSQKIGLGSVSDINAASQKNAPNGGSACVENFGNRQFTSAGNVKINNSFFVKVERVFDMVFGFVYARIKSPRSQFYAQVVGTNADNLGRFLKRRPACYEIHSVTQIRFREFSGHVFNLATTKNWYTANGFISHNCRCVAIPVFDTGVTDDPELLALLNKK
jgi:hypothetical protein